MSKQAVLLVAHGTPQTVDEIPEYLRNVTGGRPLPQPVVEEIQRRYARIGRSPLTEITQEQARLIEVELARAGWPVHVYVGMRNWQPYVADTLRQMKADGVQEAAVVCMAPQNSRTSVGLYRRVVSAAAEGLRIEFVAGWAEQPLLAEAFAERLCPALDKLRKEIGGPVSVLFTAHSVPCRTVESAEGQPADPYVTQAHRTAELVASRVPQLGPWRFAFQSQGASGGPWLGPSVEQTLDELAAAGARAVLLQPIGFVCDHVEILYDVDIAFRSYARQLGLRLERPESLNNSPTLARAVAQVAAQGLDRLRG